MAEIYTYRAEVFVAVPNIDLTGFDVEAIDGHIGKVDEATYDTGSSCLVVDTGFWIFGKKRMIPAGVVERLDPDERKVFVSMTKDQIKDAPDYDADRHKHDERGHHDENAGYYEQHSRGRQTS
jgi:hypothetical protein